MSIMRKVILCVLLLVFLGLPLIAEDLGLITKDVDDLRESLGLPGMRILQFAFSDPNNKYLPHHYDFNCVAYTGTHDNDTTRGWYANLNETDRDFVRRFMQNREDDARFGDGYAIISIDRADPVHAAQGQEQRASVRWWRGAAGHAGVPALRDERHPQFSGKSDNGRNLLCRCGGEEAGGGAMHPATPVSHPRLNIARIGDDAFRAEDPLRLFNQLRLRVGHEVQIACLAGVRDTGRCKAWTSRRSPSSSRERATA